MARRWLLSVTWAGQVWRFASAPCVPLDGAVEVPHRGGLDVDDLEETSDILTQVPEIRSVALSLLWPSPGVAYYISRGFDLAGAWAELSLWTDGTDYGEREIHIYGRLTEPEWGSAEEPVIASLEEVSYTDTSTWPEPSLTIDETTWPDAPEASLGRSYPQIRGLPGHLTGRAAIARDIPGIMAPAIGTISIGGVPHRHVLLTQGQILAPTVTLWDSAGVSVTCTVSYRPDGRSRQCAVVDIFGIPGAFSSTEDEYAVAFPSAGGRPGEDGRECQRAGDVLVARLAETKLRIDWSQVRAVAPLLDWLVVVQADEAPCSPWQWLQDHLLPLLPVSLVPSGRGWRAIVWRYGATAGDARYRLVAGVNCDHVTAIRQEGQKTGSGIVNDCTVRFGRDASIGSLVEWVRCSGRDPLSARDDTSSAARASRLALATPDGSDTGDRPEEIQADIVYSERAARQIALWRVEALGSARRLVQYRIRHDEGLDIGDVVALTDDDRYMDDVACLVCGRIVSPADEQTVTLMVLR